MNTVESLMKLKRDELIALCKERGISGYSKLKKEELIEKLSAAQEAEDAPSAAAVEAPAAADGPAAPAVSEKEKAPDDDLSLYCTALVNLWGIAPASVIAAVYNQDKGTALTAEDVKNAAPCAVIGDDLVHRTLADNEETRTALRRRQDPFPFYVPKSEYITDYAAEDFREKTHAFCAMRDFLVRGFDLTEQTAAEHTRHVIRYLDDAADLRRLLDELAEAGVRFRTETEFNNFAILLENIRAATRFWGMRGHTGTEAAGFAAKKAPVRVIKVGPNAPCPCGSGKKYKKCCGR